MIAGWRCWALENRVDAFSSHRRQKLYVHVGFCVARALLSAARASGRASLQQRRDDRVAIRRLATDDPAVVVQMPVQSRQKAYACSQRHHVVLAQVRVGVGPACLRTVVQRVDRGGDQVRVDNDGA